MSTLILDVESTGLDTSNDRIIELAVARVDEKWNVLSESSFLIREAGYPVLSPEIEALTGITQQELEEKGIPLSEALFSFGQGLDDVMHIVAYNREFDQNIVAAEVNRAAAGMIRAGFILTNTPWICAMKDVEANLKMKCWKLAHLALDHGIAVDPADLHRAGADVELTRKVLAKLGESPEKMLEFQRLPWAFLRALIPAPWEDGGVGKGLCQKLGYNWETAKGTDGPKFEKAWVKRVKEKYVDEEIQKAPFKVRRITGLKGGHDG